MRTNNDDWMMGEGDVDSIALVSNALLPLRSRVADKSESAHCILLMLNVFFLFVVQPLICIYCRDGLECNCGTGSVRLRRGWQVTGIPRGLH